MIFGRRPSPERKIGIWGLTGAGKTTYLASLWIAFARNYYPDWKIWPTNPAAENLFVDYSGDLDRGIFPPATDPDANPIQYDFSLSYSPSRGRVQNYNLCLIDAAGRHVLDDSDPYGYFKLLSECTGILLMIDPNPIVKEQERAGYLGPITRLLFKLKGRIQVNGKISTHIALCATKCDMGKWPRRAGHPSGVLREVMGPAAYGAVTSNCQSFCEFAVSSVGLRKTFEKECVPNKDYIMIDNQRRERIPDMDRWEPKCLLAPIKWLVDPISNQCECQDWHILCK